MQSPSGNDALSAESEISLTKFPEEEALISRIRLDRLRTDAPLTTEGDDHKAPWPAHTPTEVFDARFNREKYRSSAAYASIACGPPRRASGGCS